MRRIVRTQRLTGEQRDDDIRRKKRPPQELQDVSPASHFATSREDGLRFDPLAGDLRTLPAASRSSPELSAGLLELQRSHGNAYVRQLIERHSATQDLPSPTQAGAEKPGDHAGELALTARELSGGMTSGLSVQRSPGAAEAAPDVVTWVMQGLAGIADEVQLSRAEDEINRKRPQIERLLRDNPGQGVLVITIMKQPDPRTYDPAVRGMLSWSFVGVFLRVGSSREEAIAEWEAQGIVAEPGYVYDRRFGWVPPLPE